MEIFSLFLVTRFFKGKNKRKREKRREEGRRRPMIDRPPALSCFSGQRPFAMKQVRVRVTRTCDPHRRRRQTKTKTRGTKVRLNATSSSSSSSSSGSGHGRTTSGPRRLRGVLSDETLGCVVTPCCHDALSAKLIEHAGFSASFVSGFTTSASKGLPDCGLVSYSEMLDQVSSISKALTTMPIIVDGDNGFGNAMNVKRTVRGYREAGVGGVLLEDQLVPKSW